MEYQSLCYLGRWYKMETARMVEIGSVFQTNQRWKFKRRISSKLLIFLGYAYIPSQALSPRDDLSTIIRQTIELSVTDESLRLFVGSDR